MPNASGNPYEGLPWVQNGPISPPISLSIGGTQMTEKDTSDTLIARADKALYQEKKKRLKTSR